MVQLNILALAWVVGFAAGAPPVPCCTQKSVGGVSYILVQEADTSGYNCLSPCVYQKFEDPEESLFCFAAGDLEVVCGEGGEFTVMPGGVCGSDEITYDSAAQATTAGTTVLCGWPCPCESKGTLRIEEGGAVYQQSYQVKMSLAAISLEIEVEPHNKVSATTVFFETDEGNKMKWSEKYLLKFGQRCFLATHRDPGMISEMVNGLREGSQILSRLNKTIMEDNEEKSYKLIRHKRRTEHKVSDEMLRICPNNSIIEVEEMVADHNDYSALTNGQIIFSDTVEFQLNNNSDCEIRSAMTFEDPAGGCYHWINPGTGGNLSIHEYVSWVDTAYCCYTYPDGDPDCCDDIINNWLWNDMIAPDYQGNFCRCEDITSSVMFNICFEGTVGGGGK